MAEAELMTYLRTLFEFFGKSCIAGLGIVGVCCLIGLGIKSMLRMFQ